MHSNSIGCTEVYYTSVIGCPKIFPLSALVMYWLSYMTRISSLKAKNERKTLIFTQLKISRYNQHFFAIFRRILLKWTPTYLLPDAGLGDKTLGSTTGHPLSQSSSIQPCQRYHYLTSLPVFLWRWRWVDRWGRMSTSRRRHWSLAILSSHAWFSADRTGEEWPPLVPGWLRPRCVSLLTAAGFLFHRGTGPNWVASPRQANSSIVRCRQAALPPNWRFM